MHSLIICNDSELKKFKEGKLFLRRIETDRIWSDEPVLIGIDAAYALYQESYEEGSLPKLTKAAFKELLCDPPTCNDYEYMEDNTHVNWNFSKHNYSESTLKQLENYHENELSYIFNSKDFPKCYTYMKVLADKKDQSKKKLNVLKFTVWD